MHVEFGGVCVFCSPDLSLNFHEFAENFQKNVKYLVYIWCFVFVSIMFDGVDVVVVVVAVTLSSYFLLKHSVALACSLAWKLFQLTRSEKYLWINSEDKKKSARLFQTLQDQQQCDSKDRVSAVIFITCIRVFTDQEREIEREREESN